MEQITSNFTGKTIFCGLDVHKSSWNLGIHLEDVFLRNVHQKPSPKVLLEFLQKNYPGATYKTAYEAGKFGFWIHRQLTALGIECIVVNPADIPKTQKDKLQKTDANDSRNIGYRLQKGELRGIHVPDEQQEADRCFFRHRKKILKDLTRCKNRIKGLLSFSGIDLPAEYDNACWSQNFIKWLKALDCKQVTRRKALDYMVTQLEFLRVELLKISNDIRKMLREARFNKNYYLLRTIPGIGPLTAGSLLVEIGDVKRFATFPHLNSFIGLLPMEHSSGESTSVGNLTVRKHKQLRSDLVEAAWTAKRTDPAMSLYYADQIKAGKDSKIIIIKIARKLLNRVRYVLLNQKEYVKGVVK